jgi:hypothetical protein
LTYTHIYVDNNIDVHADADANNGVRDDDAGDNDAASDGDSDGDDDGHRLKSTKCTFTPDKKNSTATFPSSRD